MTQDNFILLKKGNMKGFINGLTEMLFAERVLTLFVLVGL